MSLSCEEPRWPTYTVACFYGKFSTVPNHNTFPRMKEKTMSNKNTEFVKQIGNWPLPSKPVNEPIREESAEGNPPPLNWEEKPKEHYEGWA